MNALLLYASLLSAVVADAPALSIAPDGDPVRVVVRMKWPDAPAGLASGIAESDGRRLLTLSLKPENAGDAPSPLFGVYTGEDGQLVFRPRFGLVRGSTYVATALAAGRPVATIEYTVPAADMTPVTTVATVSPSGERLPANVLKFYLTFSGPMREGREVLERIRLLDAAGKDVPDPWRDVELWSSGATRLSLFIHPGRIKQGVNLREEQGPVLRPGEKYTLVVGADLRDAASRALAKEFRYTFTTTAELHAKVDTAAWKLVAPKPGSRDPLVVTFDRPLDRFLAEKGLAVHDDTGQELLGRAEASADGLRCSWIPTDRWSAGGYELRIDPLLEDLCGNTPARVFDTDLEAVQVEVLPPPLARPFVVQ